MTTTQLAPRYDPSAIESDIYRRWVDAGVFSPTPGGQPYVIVIPPPNVTDRLHMGHGLNNTLQDVLIRFERMRGRETLWLPGTDHAGIATQNVVERLLAKEGTTRHDLGREAFVERVRSYVEATGGTILKQLEAIGASCDWSRTRYTLDEAYSVAVRKVFVDLFHEGLIYRGHRVIHWCPRCLTSLSDEEAEFHERDGEMFYIRYPVGEARGAGGAGEAAERQGGRAAGAAGRPVRASAIRHAGGEESEAEGAFVVVATTRPETMFGDIALVYHPDDARYAGYDGRRVRIPLSDVPIPIRRSTAVEREFGTGMLKVTPAHDPNDFDIAGTLDPDSERPVVLTEDARMADDPRVPEAFRGLDREAARTAIVERLRDAGLLERTEPHRHAVRQCYRCNTVIEPRLSEQWFVRMEPLAAPALTAYGQGRLQILPERWGKIYRNWLENIRDWNISRQLWWGHRVPAFYCERCSHITVAMDDPAACDACGGAVRQDEDVLDTWFSSWLWPFATLGWPERTPDLARYYPGHTLSTAAEIIFFWVARMVMAGYHFPGERPFETVFIHGTVRDTLHRKMSKSLGNGIDPLAVVEQYGADALRFTVIAGAPLGTDVILDPDDLETSFAPGRNFANKLWNVGRLILSHFDGECPPLALDSAQFALADRWILSRCQRAVADTTEALERFRLNDAANRVYHFLWDELADWYLEQVKPRLYGEAQGGDVARGILCRVLETTLRLLHPVMPFITEELWGHIPGEREPLLATAAWPVVQSALVDDEAEDRFGRVQALITAVRTIRAEYGVPPSATVHAHVQPASPETVQALNAEQRTIERLAKIGRLRRDGRPEDVGAHDVLPDGTSIFVPLGDAIDVAQECGRLRRERERLDELLRGVTHKLANRQFVERAPADVVEREREKERSWREQRDGLVEKLLSLGCQ